MSVKDQLNEMNKDSQIHTKYEWDGSKIVPKAIKVALLHKNAFTRNIAVSYKKIVRKDARYRKQISITTGSFMA
uniref:Uncharacterized protein n=1 Tax=Romanomermis culicivorax TaxID=13658 RepID=A0A915I2H2_ROMCU